MKLVWDKTDQPNEWLANNHPEMYLIRFTPETSDGGHFTLFRLRGRGMEYIVSSREKSFCEARALELAKLTIVTGRTPSIDPALGAIPKAKFERHKT